MNKTIFKAYDIRGVVPDELNEEDAYCIARSFASFLARETSKDNLRVAIGQDNRLSSPTLHAAVIKGIIESGCDAIDIGLAPTPVFYFAVSHLNLDGGINVTASHNPPKYNGLKAVRAGAAPIGKNSGLQDILKICEEHDFLIPNERGAVSEKSVMEAYIDTILNLAPLPDVSSIKVVVDTGNGVAGILCKEYFSKIGVRLTPLFFELDGTFPNHMPDPLKHENVAALIEEVNKQKADLGIALDADADRVFFIDEKGNHLPSDLITALVAQHILSQKKDEKIIYDLRSSRVVKETIKRYGGTALISKVGHAFIKDLMRKENVIFAGELSGHFYYRDIGFFDAPFLVVNAILSLLAHTGKPLSELLLPLQKYAKTPEINFTVADKEAIIKKIEQTYSDGVLSYLDGLTVEYPDWWFNVRPSNTEPVLRLNLEANTENLKMEHLKRLEAIITSL